MVICMRIKQGRKQGDIIASRTSVYDRRGDICGKCKGFICWMGAKIENTVD